jgi:hypothetical protein
MTDSELIYLTKTENLQHAKEILNDKYLAYLKNLNNKFNTKLYGSWKKDTSENLTKAYMVFDECLSTLESKCAYDFGKKLTLTCKSSLINEIRSYITYKRCLLDKSISIDSNAETDYEDNKQQIQNELLHSYKMQLVNNFLEGKPRVIKLIVKMRRLGFD